MDVERVIEFASNHWILSSGYFLVAVLLIQDFYDALTSRHRGITPEAAVRLMNDDRTVVVDVSEPHEFAKGHIANAMSIPLSSLDDKVISLEHDKDAPIIVTCKEGTRSLEACKKLTKRGFTQVNELKGGMLAWTDAKLPISVKKKK
jgi:rhodanese-related sulfurtransferase